jgi:hypothetical protein
MIFLFDFDLTLVSARGRMPRQTRHALQRLITLGHCVGIVTNNRLAPLMFSELGLLPLVPLTRVVVSTEKRETRPELVARWFALVQGGEPSPFFYFDDLEGQAEAVGATEACLGSYCVKEVATLYLLVRECLSQIS